MSQHVYFRAMPYEDYNYFNSTEEMPTNQSVTWWADGREPASFYQAAGRVIVKMTLDAPLPEQYKGIAHFAMDDRTRYNHREWQVPIEAFNDFVGAHLEALEIV